MAFSPLVESWRPLANEFSSDAPVDYVLDWIRGESGGNRCNLTQSAGFPEVGLFQLDPGNAAAAGTDHATLRSGCNGQQDVSGSDSDRRTAMATGIAYINELKKRTKAKLAAVGSPSWPETDPGFWALLRLQFSAGEGATTQWLATAAQALGRGPANWDEFIEASGAGSNHWVQVSAANSQYAVGFAPSISKQKVALWVFGILGFIGGAFVAHRRAQ
jgi:hypothetical protein